MEQHPEIGSVHEVEPIAAELTVPKNCVVDFTSLSHLEPLDEWTHELEATPEQRVADFLRRTWPSFIRVAKADQRVRRWLAEFNWTNSASQHICILAAYVYQRLLQLPANQTVETLAAAIRSDGGLLISQAEGSLALSLLLRANLLDTNEDGTLRPIAVTRPLPPSGTQSDFALHYLQPITRKCQQPKKGVLDA